MQIVCHLFCAYMDANAYQRTRYVYEQRNFTSQHFLRISDVSRLIVVIITRSSWPSANARERFTQEAQRAEQQRLLARVQCRQGAPAQGNCGRGECGSHDLRGRCGMVTSNGLKHDSLLLMQGRSNLFHALIVLLWAFRTTSKGVLDDNASRDLGPNGLNVLRVLTWA